MRPKILLICGIVLAFCIWLLLYQAGKQQKVLANKSDEVATNQLNQLRQPQQPDVTTESFSNSNIKSSVSQAVPNTNHAATEEQRKQFIANWQAPIDFYGQVVDENTNPVEGANVQFEWDESPMVDVPIYEVLVTHTDPANDDTGDTGVIDGCKEMTGDGWSNLEKFWRRVDPLHPAKPPATIELKQPTRKEILEAVTPTTDLSCELQMEVRTNGSTA